MRRQDWNPHCGDSDFDSQADAQPVADTQEELLGQPRYEDSQPTHEPSDTLDQLMGNLEANLPEEPVPGPERPQVLSPTGSRTSQSSAPSPEPGASLTEKHAQINKVLPTPCRTASTPNMQVPNQNATCDLKDCGRMCIKLHNARIWSYTILTCI